ncbi:hypothetical protein H632_c848p1 [Helicosporidium sp. ATCC 50920]|nr:hypothetical protein H632_c848p1 [Helicosporidium sp. ATCC 50920]|eukprot:KDD75139.1 hypothetical protein H632_c848p1 [Helicosporidium sp. ATCC 50920]
MIWCGTQDVVDGEETSSDEEELGDAGENGGRDKQSRAEKKSRKAIQKLGMKAMPDIASVHIRKSKNILFVINRPDVYKAPTSDTYVIFGEAKIEDLSAQMAGQAAEQYRMGARGSAASGSAPSAAAPKPVLAPAEESEDENEVVDETGVDPKDIELVMSQSQASRKKVVKALKAAGGDIVNAIMELTM